MPHLREATELATNVDPHVYDVAAVRGGRSIPSRVALGAMATGAMAIGAYAVGGLAIGRLAIGALTASGVIAGLRMALVIAAGLLACGAVAILIGIPQQRTAARTHGLHRGAHLSRP